MSQLTVILVIVGYLAVLMLFSYFTSRHSRSNNDFFVASRRSKWYLVAFGMIGSSVSGISLVAVPAMVATAKFTYLQMWLCSRLHSGSHSASPHILSQQSDVDIRLSQRAFRQ